MKGFKIFTHDLRPPIQGGAPVWNGKLPFEFPTVELDESTDECGAGWNFVKDIKTGLKIARLWPTGRPSRVFSVEATGKVVERCDKIRTDKLTVLACAEMLLSMMSATAVSRSYPEARIEPMKADASGGASSNSACHLPAMCPPRGSDCRLGGCESPAQTWLPRSPVAPDLRIH